MKRETKKEVEKKLTKNSIVCVWTANIILVTPVLIVYIPLVRDHILKYDLFYGSLIMLVFGVFLYTLFRSGYLFGRLKVMKERKF